MASRNFCGGLPRLCRSQCRCGRCPPTNCPSWMRSSGCWRATRSSDLETGHTTRARRCRMEASRTRSTAQGLCWTCAWTPLWVWIPRGVRHWCRPRRCGRGRRGVAHLSIKAWKALQRRWWLGFAPLFDPSLILPLRLIPRFYFRWWLQIETGSLIDSALKNNNFNLDSSLIAISQ